MRPTWLPNDPPKMVVEAMKLYGIHEGIGAADNPTILAWAREIDVVGYVHDSTPWCGLFMGVVAMRAGHGPLPLHPLWALGWTAWGAPSPRPSLGDVLVFQRPGGGHVCLYVGEDEACFYCLGGNESDEVQCERILKTRLHAARRPLYKVEPASVKPLLVAPGETIISRNEA